MSRFEETAQQMQEAMANFRFDLASQTLHEFIWNEYCDWYVELSKPVLWDEEANPEAARMTRRVLLSTLEKSLRLLHPFMPFITEEVWQKLAPLLGISGDSIMLQPYPEFDASNIDEQAEADIAWLKGVIVSIRNIRGEMDIAPGKAIVVLLKQGNERDRQNLEAYRLYLQKLAKLESVRWLEDDEEVPASATGLHAGMEIMVPLAGLIDVAAEQARLNKEIAKLEAGLKQVNGKLGNARFVENAPEAVVQKEKEKQQKFSDELAALQEKLTQLQDV
jgi:valyl-tRNA synthetase